MFFLLFFAFVGIAGDIGYTLYDKAYQIAAGVAAAVWVAYPKFKEIFCKLII